MANFLEINIILDDNLARQGWKSGVVSIDTELGIANIEMKGYENGQAIADGKISSKKLRYEIPDITVLTNFQAVYDEIVTLMIDDPDSPFRNALLKPVPDPTP